MNEGQRVRDNAFHLLSNFRGVLCLMDEELGSGGVSV